MTSEQFREALKLLGLTQREFATHVGIGTRTVRDGLKRGVVNKPLSILLALLLQNKITLTDIDKAKFPKA